MLSNKEENLIKWEKWTDPFGMDQASELEDDSPEYEEEETDQQNIPQNEVRVVRSKNIQMIATPMGMIPMNEHTASGKIFNLWVGHTNFNITPGVANTIEETDGVETLDIFTRYRFRISAGKAFTDSVVMRSINTRVYNFLDTYDEK